MRRLLLSASVAAVVLGVISPPPASAQQTFNIYLGGFVPRSADAREHDVLVSNLGCDQCFDFEIGDFKGPTFGAEWLVALGNRFEAGLGIGVYSRTVPSVYAHFTDSDGSEIEQDLKLRVVPFSATVRFLPLGRNNGVEPYLGVGAGVFAWRYSEAGEFVNFSRPGRPISGGVRVGSGSARGPIVLGGVRVPVGPVGVGGEVRYQSARGSLPADQQFSGTTIDLGGFNYLLTLNLRF